MVPSFTYVTTRGMYRNTGPLLVAPTTTLGLLTYRLTALTVSMRNMCRTESMIAASVAFILHKSDLNITH
jgi:hypothetical protein